MEIFLLDDTFRTLYTLDVFESLIWTERYNGYGDFELYMPIDQSVLDIADLIRKKMEEKKDFFLWLKDSGSAMVIENLEIATNTETGNHLTMSGRGLESLLERRIIWKQTSLNGKLQDGIKRLINESIISPEISERKISNFTFSNSTNSYITSLTLNAQYTGDNLYDTIFAICDAKQLGFDVMLDDSSNFVFSLRYREDRSYDQEKNPYVIFSPKFENFINSDYLESIKTLKNVTLVAGEDSGSKRKTKIVGSISESGLSRRELYTDARDIQSESYRDKLVSDTEALNNYKESLHNSKADYIKIMNEYAEVTSEHQTKMDQYEETESNMMNRLDVFRNRTQSLIHLITLYVLNSLTLEQQAQYDKRKEYIQSIKDLEETINDYDTKIKNYKNKINNEGAITIEKLISYEENIESIESKKKNAENKKSGFEQKKSDIEKTFPDYNTTLKKYEEKKDQYTDIMDNDGKTLYDTQTAIEKENDDYEKKNKQYVKKLSDQQELVKQYQDLVNQYEELIIKDEQEVEQKYNELLEQRGTEKLSENVYTKTFTGEIDTAKTFVYDKDFFKGDIVQISNEYGMSTKAKVSELVRTQDTSGYTTYPTFQIIE